MQRRLWKMDTADSYFSHLGGVQWAQFFQGLRYPFTEVARTPEYVELMAVGRDLSVRLYDGRLIQNDGSGWTGPMSYGHWEGIMANKATLSAEVQAKCQELAQACKASGATDWKSIFTILVPFLLQAIQALLAGTQGKKATAPVKCPADVCAVHDQVVENAGATLVSAIECRACCEAE